jgi:hypothetical protein
VHRGAFILLAALTAAGCAKAGSPEQVADAFSDAYFRRMDQEKAKEYTALGATKMLEDELHDVADIRKEGYTPGEAGAEVKIRRGETTRREERVRIPYEIAIHTDAGDAVKDADVELARIDGMWKVVRVGLKAR